MTFTENLLHESYNEAFNTDVFCLDLANIYVYFIASQNNKQCDLQNLMFKLKLDCQDNGQTSNIIIKPLEIQDNILLPFDINGPNTGIVYEQIPGNQINYDTELVIILEKFQIGLEGQFLIVNFYNLYFLKCIQPILILDYLRDIQLHNITIDDYYNSEDNCIKGFMFGQIVLRNCLFTNPPNLEEIRLEYLYFMKGGDIYIYNSVFKNNKTQYSGCAVNQKNNRVFIYDTDFIDNQTNQSGVIRFMYVEEVELINVKFYNNKAGIFGGAIYFKGQQNTVLLQNVEIYDSYVQGEFGGAIYMPTSLSTVTIIDCIFKNNSVTNQGGALYFYDTQGVTIKGTLIQDNKALLSSGIYIGATNIIDIQDVKFIGNTFQNELDFNGKVGGLHIDNINSNDSASTKIILKKLKFYDNIQFETGALKIENILDGELFEMHDIEFFNNEATYNEGGAVQFVNIKIPYSLEKTTFYNNKSMKSGGSLFIQQAGGIKIDGMNINKSSSQMTGGSIYFEGNSNNLILKNVQINNSQSQVNGGAIFIEKGNNILLENIVIDDVQTKKVGSLFLKYIDVLTIINLEISNVMAYSSGGIYLESISNSNFQDIKIKNSKVEQNNGGGYFFQVTDSIFKNIQLLNNDASVSVGAISIANNQNNTFEDLIIQNNIAYENAGGLQFTNSDNIIFNNIKLINNQCNKIGGGMDMIYITNSHFNTGIFSDNKSIQKIGGAISLENCQNINFNNAQFNNNIAMTGGAISMVKATKINFQYSQFYENMAGVTGGALFISESQELNFQDLNIHDNQASQNGGGLTVLQVTNLNIKDIQLNNNKAVNGNGGGLYLNDRVKQFKIDNGQIGNNQANHSGGGIFIDFVEDIIFNSIQFQNNQSNEYGGSLYIYNSEIVQIMDSEFVNHLEKILDGSCIYVYNQIELVLLNNNFINNKSLMEGGAIKSLNTQNLTINNNIFTNNTVSDQQIFSQGGSIYIENTNNFNYNKNSIINSYATSKGGCVFLMNIVQTQINDNIFNSCHVKFDENLPQQQKTVTYQLTQGGGIYYEIKDIILENSNTKIQLQMNNNQFLQNQASSGAGIFINQNFQNYVKLNIQKNQFKNNIADIGPILRILGYVQKQEEQQIQNFINQGGNKALVSEDLVQTGYISNEKLIDKDYAHFELCDEGQNLKEGGAPLCKLCNRNGICDGGYNKMYPKEGYWRFDKESDEYFHCEQNPEACLGNDICKEGHTGLLCEKCDKINNYSESKEGCSKCSAKINQYISLVVMFLITCTLLGNQIYGLSSRIKKRMIQKCITKLYDLCFQKVSQLPGITKIFLMHAQIMYLIATFKLKFPYEVTSSIEVIGNPHTVFSNSLNCLVPVENENDILTTEYYLTYYGLAITVGTLIFLIFIEFLLYLGTQFIQHKKQLIEYFQGSVVCFFLMIQPGLLQNSLNFVVCREFGDQSFSSADTNINCSDDFYKYSILPINISVIILIGFIIPIFLGCLLVRYQKLKKLKMAVVKRSLGILYMEVKNQYYFWEIIAIIVKITIVVISISFQQKITLKGCLCCIVLIIYLIVCHKLKPFATQNLNNLSLIATITQTLSIILVMCVFEIEQEKEETDQTLSIIPILLIIIMNFVFFGFASYLILKEFEQIFRVSFMKYFKSNGKLYNYIQLQIEKEKAAKEKWRLIKIGIHHSSMAKRRLLHNQHYHIQTVKLNTEQMFYDYVQYAFQNRQKINYLDEVKLEQSQLDNIIKYVSNQIQNSNIQLTELQQQFSISGICEKIPYNDKIINNNNKNSTNVLQLESPQNSKNQFSKRKLLAKSSNDCLSQTTKISNEKLNTLNQNLNFITNVQDVSKNEIITNNNSQMQMINQQINGYKQSIGDYDNNIQFDQYSPYKKKSTINESQYYLEETLNDEEKKEIQQNINNQIIKNYTKQNQQQQ